MSDALKKKEAIKKAYPHSKTWASKVDGMSESRVIAIFLRMTRDGKI